LQQNEFGQSTRLVPDAEADVVGVLIDRVDRWFKTDSPDVSAGRCPWNSGSCTGGETVSLEAWLGELTVSGRRHPDEVSI
jgi:hypothetical protein